MAEAQGGKRTHGGREPRMLKALSCIPVLQKAGLVAQAYSLSIWEVGAEGLAVQSYSLISGEFKA